MAATSSDFPAFDFLLMTLLFSEEDSKRLSLGALVWLSEDCLVSDRKDFAELLESWIIPESGGFEVATLLKMGRNVDWLLEFEPTEVSSTTSFFVTGVFELFSSEGLESVSDSGSELDDDETSEDTSELEDCIEESDPNSPEGGWGSEPESCAELDEESYSPRCKLETGLVCTAAKQLEKK